MKTGLFVEVRQILFEGRERVVAEPHEVFSTGVARIRNEVVSGLAPVIGVPPQEHVSQLSGRRVGFQCRGKPIGPARGIGNPLGAGFGEGGELAAFLGQSHDGSELFGQAPGSPCLDGVVRNAYRVDRARRRARPPALESAGTALVSARSACAEPAGNTVTVSVRTAWPTFGAGAAVVSTAALDRASTDSVSTRIVSANVAGRV